MRRQRLRALRARVVALTQVAAGKNPETNEAECSKVRGLAEVAARLLTRNFVALLVLNTASNTCTVRHAFERSHLIGHGDCKDTLPGASYLQTTSGHAPSLTIECTASHQQTKCMYLLLPREFHSGLSRVRQRFA